jgi:hypothetical protein
LPPEPHRLEVRLEGSSSAPVPAPKPTARAVGDDLLLSVALPRCDCEGKWEARASGEGELIRAYFYLPCPPDRGGDDIECADDSERGTSVDLFTARIVGGAAAGATQVAAYVFQAESGGFAPAGRTGIAP